MQITGCLVQIPRAGDRPSWVDTEIRRSHETLLPLDFSDVPGRQRDGPGWMSIWSTFEAVSRCALPEGATPSRPSIGSASLVARRRERRADRRGCGKTTALRIAMGLETAPAARSRGWSRGQGCAGTTAAWGFSSPICCVAHRPATNKTRQKKTERHVSSSRMRACASPTAATATRYLELVGLVDSLSRRPHTCRGH